MTRKPSSYIALLILGICCITASFFFNSEESKAIAGILIGVGSSSIGLSISGLVAKHIERKNPERQKQIQIDYLDERNTLIRYRAKAKAGDITQWLIMGIAYITILISTPLWVTLAVVTVFVIYNILGFYLMSKYEKEM